MTPEFDEIAITEAESRRIAEVVRACDLGTPVTHLSRWKVRDVVAHLGGVHRWATRVVTNRSMDGPSFTKSKLDGAELCDWFDEGVVELMHAFRSIDRHEPCPNFNPGTANTMAFWLRRQMHETTVHRWDIEQALGCTTPIEAALAADGIDEFFDVFVRRRGKQTLSGPLRVSSTQPARSWTLSLAEKPGRIDVDADGVGLPTTELSGLPDQLLLMLWGRLTRAEAGLTTTGDQSVSDSL